MADKIFAAEMQTKAIRVLNNCFELRKNPLPIVHRSLK